MNVPEHRVRVTSDGLIEALGSDAAERLRARAGTFDLLAGPNDIVVLRRSDKIDDAELEAPRPCMLFGEIRSGEFYEVLQFVGQARWCGELLVQSRARRSIFFDQGNVVAVESTEEQETLGEVFCRAGVLTRTQVDECSRMRGDGPLRFGEVAVALGFMTEEQLFAEMARQITDVFASVARLEGGTFYFFAGFDETRLSFRTQKPVEALLLEVIRRIDETNYFRGRVPSPRHVPRKVEGRAPPVDQVDLYEAIDGKRSVEELCICSPSPSLDVTRALFELVQTGHVTLAPPRFNPAAVVDVYNKAISFLLVELDAMDAGDGVRDKLVRFAADAQYAAFFNGAGPADDGTLDGETIALNLEAAGGGPDEEQRLARRLYDYASYALFLARPHFDRRDAKLATDENSRLASKVVAMLEPLAPPGGTTLGPPPTKAAPVAKAVTPLTPTRRSNRFESIPFPGVDVSRTARLPAYVSPSDDSDVAPSTVQPSKSRGHLKAAAAASTVHVAAVDATIAIAKPRGVPRASAPDYAPSVPRGSSPDYAPQLARPQSSPEFPRSALPRPQSSPEFPRSALPRPQSSPEFPRSALPRPASSPELAPSNRWRGSSPDFGPISQSALQSLLSRPGARHAAFAIIGALTIALITAVLVGRRSPSPTVANGKSALVVVCDPACEGIYVDGVRQTAVSGKPFEVPPGGHDVVVASRGRATQHKRVNVGAASEAVVFELPSTP